MSNISRMLEKENFTTLDTSIFSSEKDPESNISPQQNMLQIVSICESFILDLIKITERTYCSMVIQDLEKLSCVTVLQNLF